MTDTSVLSNYLAGQILDRYVTQPTVWATLMTADPGPADDRSFEATGPGYTRIDCSFGPAANRAVLNDTAGRWRNVPPGDYWGVAFYTQISGGNLLWRSRFVDADGAPVKLSSQVLAAAPFTVGDFAFEL